MNYTDVIPEEQVTNTLNEAFPADRQDTPLDGLSEIDGQVDERNPKVLTPNIARTGRLAAVATLEPADATAEMYAQLTKIYTEMGQMWQTEKVRQEAFHSEMVARSNALTYGLAANKVDTYQDMERRGYFAHLNYDEAMRQKTYMERTAVDRILELEAMGNTTASRMMFRQLERGSAVDVTADFYARQALMSSDIGELVPEAEQDWFNTVAGYALGLFGPYYEQLGKTNNVKIPNVTRSIGDLLLGGQRVEDESNYLYSLPFDQFKKVWREEVLPQVRDSAQTFGFYDRQKQIRILQSLLRAPNIVESNTFQALDIATALPIAGIIKFGDRTARGVVDIAKGVGAKNVAAEATAEAVVKISKEGDEAALKSTGITRDEAVENTAPGAVNTSEAAIQFKEDLYEKVKSFVGKAGVIKWNDIRRLGGFSAVETTAYIKRLITEGIVEHDTVNNIYRIKVKTEDGTDVVLVHSGNPFDDAVKDNSEAMLHYTMTPPDELSQEAIDLMNQTAPELKSVSSADSIQGESTSTPIENSYMNPENRFPLSERDRLRDIFASRSETQRYLQPPPKSEDDVAKFSKTESKPTAPISTREQIVAALNRYYGAAWERIKATSRIKVVSTIDDLPVGLRKQIKDEPGIQAIMQPHTKKWKGGTSHTVWFIASNISEDMVPGLIKHEIGWHVGMSKWFKKEFEFYKAMDDLVRNLITPGSKNYDSSVADAFPLIQDAYRNLTDTVYKDFATRHVNISSEHEQIVRRGYVAEETVAFVLESNINGRGYNGFEKLHQSFISMFRVQLAKWLPQHFVKKLTVKDLEWIALQNIRRHAKDLEESIPGFSSGIVKPSVKIVRPVSINAAVNKKLVEFRKIEERIKEIVRVPRLTEQEMQEAVEGTIKQVRKELDDIDYLKDVQMVTKTSDIQLASGSSVKQVQFTVGEYTTADQARNAAMDLGVGADSIVRDSATNLFHVQFSRNVRETGFFTPLDDTRETNILARYALGARQIGARILTNQGQMAGNASAKIMRELGDFVSETFTGLAKDERGRVEEVLRYTEANWKKTERYPTEDEINLLFKRQWNRAPTEKELSAIHLAHELNDLDFALRNDEMYKIKAINGQESVSMDVAGVIAKQENASVKEDWVVGANDLVAVADASDGLKVYSKLNPLSGDKANNLRAQGYVMVRFEEPITLGNKTAVQSVLVKKAELVREPLKRQQLGYAGPHRMYDAGGVFLKQASIGVNPDGLRYFKMPKVFATGTRAEMTKLVEQLEAARQVYVKALKDGRAVDPADLDGILPHWFKSEEFIDAIEGGMIQHDMPFRAMGDREVLPEYISYKNEDVVDFRHDNEPTDVMALMRTQGQMYVSGKGERLVNWQGEAAKILDPFKTIDMAMRNIASMSSFSDYKVSAMERWNETYGGFLIQKNLSPGRAISEGILDKNLPDGIRQQAEAEREVIKRTLNWQTEWDRQLDIYQRKFFDWVMGDDPLSKRHDLGQKVQNWWNNSNPVGALKMLATDLYLGLYNPAQIVLQIGTMIAATTIHPTAGMQGMHLIRPLQAYMSKSGTEAMLDTFVERGLHKTAGFATPEEFKAFMRTIKNSGFTDVERSHYWMNEGGFNAVASVFSADGALRRTGRVFLNETERANRIVAARIAYDDTVKRGLKPGTNEFTLEFFGRAEEYALSMSTQSAAAWQRGALSIPTQFWAYNARMMELMMGNTLTKEQKIRLITGQFLLYGSAGIPLLPLLSDALKEQQGTGFEVGTWQGLLDRGALDNAIFYATGQDVLVSKRLGTGGFLGDTVKDIFGWGQFGTKSFAEITLGVSGGLVTNSSKTIGDLLRYSAAEATSDQATTWAVTRENLMRLASTISTVSNFTKAYMVYKYGTYRTKTGTLLADDVPSEMAFAVAMGFQPGEVDHIGAAMSYLKNEGRAVDEAAKIYSNFRTRWAYEPDNRADIEEQVRLFSSMLPPDVRAKAIRKATQYTPQSTYDSVTQQIEEDKAAQAAYEQEGNNQ